MGRLALLSFALACLACGSGPITTEADGGSGESGLGDEEGSEGSGDGGPIEDPSGDIDQIVEGAIAHFEMEQSFGDPPKPLHLCPHFDGGPEGGEAGTTPAIDFNCNAGPDQLCVPSPDNGGAGYYHEALWSDNSVWADIGFAKTEPHAFHYNFIAVNELEGYGACSFTASAFADLDDDAIFSTYERHGTIDQDGAVVTDLIVTMPWE